MSVDWLTKVSACLARSPRGAAGMRQPACSGAAERQGDGYGPLAPRRAGILPSPLALLTGCGPTERPAATPPAASAPAAAGRPGSRDGARGAGTARAVWPACSRCARRPRPQAPVPIEHLRAGCLSPTRQPPAESPRSPGSTPAPPPVRTSTRASCIAALAGPNGPSPGRGADPPGTAPCSGAGRSPGPRNAVPAALDLRLAPEYGYEGASHSAKHVRVALGHPASHHLLPARDRAAAAPTPPPRDTPAPDR